MHLHFWQCVYLCNRMCLYQCTVTDNICVPLCNSNYPGLYTQCVFKKLSTLLVGLFFNFRRSVIGYVCTHPTQELLSHYFFFKKKKKKSEHSFKDRHLILEEIIFTLQRLFIKYIQANCSRRQTEKISTVLLHCGVIRKPDLVTMDTTLRALKKKKKCYPLHPEQSTNWTLFNSTLYSAITLV